MAHEPQDMDTFSERVAVFCAGLSLILDRLVRGEPAVEGLDSLPADIEAEHKIERVFEAELGLPRGVDPAACVGTGPCMPPPQSEVLDGMLETLVPLVRGTPWEPVLWRYLLPCVPCVIPSHVVDDLIARDVEVVLLGHQPLRDIDLWKLVEVEEALLTLAIRRYANPEYDSGEFEEVLFSARGQDWVLESLIRRDPSDTGKLDILASFVSQSDEKDSLLDQATPELREKVERLSS